MEVIYLSHEEITDSLKSTLQAAGDVMEADMMGKEFNETVGLSVDSSHHC